MESAPSVIAAIATVLAIYAVLRNLYRSVLVSCTLGWLSQRPNYAFNLVSFYLRDWRQLILAAWDNHSPAALGVPERERSPYTFTPLKLVVPHTELRRRSTASDTNMALIVYSQRITIPKPDKTQDITYPTSSFEQNSIEHGSPPHLVLATKATTLSEVQIAHKSNVEAISNPDPDSQHTIQDSDQPLHESDSQYAELSHELHHCQGNMQENAAKMEGAAVDREFEVGHVEAPTSFQSNEFPVSKWC